MRIKLEEEVRTERVLSVRVRSSLYVQKCDGCGRVFRMEKWSGNEKFLGELHGTFDSVACDKDGRGLGNGFAADVCSFQCAHEVFARGGWRKIERYRPFADADIPLARAELLITAHAAGEEKIREDWMATDESAQNHDEEWVHVTLRNAAERTQDKRDL